MLYADKCIMRRRRYPQRIVFYDLISKSDISLTKNESQRKMANVTNSSKTNIQEESLLANVSMNNLGNTSELDGWWKRDL